MEQRTRAKILASVTALTIIVGLTFVFSPPATGSSTSSLAAGCANLSKQSVSANAVRFNCNGGAALIASTTVKATPTFMLSTTGFSSLGVVLHGAASCSNTVTLKSGTGLVLSKGIYDYCAFFTAPRTFSAFALTWK